MPQLSYLTRTFVQQRLLDGATGLNHWLAVAAPDYSLAPFTLAFGTNLMLGEFALSDVTGSGYDAAWPVVMLYTKRAANIPGLVTPSEFSGTIYTVVDFYHGFLEDEPPADPESPLDMTLDAMIETFNRPDYYGLTPNGTTYNNEMDEQCMPMGEAGQNWARLQRFILTHRVISGGR